MLKKILLSLFLFPMTLFADLCDYKLDLYYKPNCPYCIKVLKVINKLKAPVTLRDVSTSQTDLNRLIQVGGKKQVPCLFINGKPMYESDDIIKWLESHAE